MLTVPNLRVLSIVLLGYLAYQDLKERQTTLWSAALFFLVNLLIRYLNHTINTLIYDYLGLAFYFLFLYLFVKLASKFIRFNFKTNSILSYLGEGDIVVLFALVTLFGLQNLLYVILYSSIIAIIVHTLFVKDIRYIPYVTYLFIGTVIFTLL